MAYIQVENISKIYPAKNPVVALKSISLEINQGEIFTLLGVNGAGKTTLSSILATLHPPTDGDILWNGKSIYKDIYTFRRSLGYCPQSPNLDPFLSLEENLIFAGRYYSLSKKEILEKKDILLEEFNLTAYAKSPVHVLSGGFKQRFSIAKTLMHSPEFIIFDEPTVGLDPQARNTLLDYISKLKSQNITILFTTHYLNEAEKISDRICIIEKGEIKIIDSPKKLQEDFQKENLEQVFLHLIESENEENS